MADRSRADATALWSGSAESNPPDTRGNLQHSAASVSARKGDVERGDGVSGGGMEGAYLVTQEARREAGRQQRRRREEETARAKDLDRAATAVAAIGVAWRTKFRREVGMGLRDRETAARRFGTSGLFTAAVAHFGPALKPN
jgi:hypothetical protein